MRLKIARCLFAVLILTLLAGCAAPTSTPAPAPTQAAQLPTQTVYPTSTAYPTFTPFPTRTVPPTPTAPPTTTPTPSATATLTPTLRSVAQVVTPKPAAPQPVGSAELWRTPGLYTFAPQCAGFYSSFSGRGWNENFCIIRVEVYPEVLRFYGIWQIKLVQGAFKTRALWHPRSTSPAFYLVDNLGNRYVHGRTGGVADADTVVQQPEYTMGYDDENNHPTTPISWWEFAPAKPGASSFTFVDDEHGIKIGPIVLSR